MKSFTTTAVASLLALVPSVLGHGHMNYIAIAGKRYDGPDVGRTMAEGSIIRGITENGPITSLSSQDLACGQGTASVTAKLTANAKAGDKVDFMWVNGDGGNWVHNVGPMQTYIASCGDSDCSDFKTAGAKWIKIDEAGLTEGTKKWALAETPVAGKPHTVTLPQDMPNGNWLLRHEIIALHNAQALGGAEFYSACAQIKVSGGSGTGSAQGISIPGAYKADDPGLHINVYDNLTGYTFPGGNVQFFRGDSAGKGSDDKTGAVSGATTTGGAGDGEDKKTTGGDDGTTDAGDGAGGADDGAQDDGSTADDGDTCDDGGDDSTSTGAKNDDASSNGDAASGSGSDVVTVTVTVTATPGPTPAAASARKRVTVTATKTVSDDGADTADAASKDTGSGYDYRPRKRSRMMIHW